MEQEVLQKTGQQAQLNLATSCDRRAMANNAACEGQSARIGGVLGGWKGEAEMDLPELRAAGLIVAPSAPDDCAEYMTGEHQTRQRRGDGDGVGDNSHGATATTKATCREVVGLAGSRLGEVQEGRRAHACG
jgi:hypothetical protein